MNEAKKSPAEQAAWNKNFLSDYLSSDESIRKTASNDLNTWLRTYQRQDGVWRKIITPQPVTEADFAEAVDTRDPFIIRTITPRSAGAQVVNFDTGTVTTSMYADKYQIFMQRVFTPKYRIDKAYLAAYKGDLIAVFKDLSLQDILATEDIMGMTIANACVGEKGVLNEDIGINQYIDAGASITPESVMYAVEGLTHSSDNLNPAQGLVHRSFWWSLIRAFRADSQGDRLAEGAILGQTKVLEESLAGIAWRTALERELVPANTAYIFAAPEYCGDFLTWGDASIFTKVEDDIWFEFFAHETIGMSFPYRGCVVRADFGNAEVDEWTEARPVSSSSSSATI